MEEPGLPTDPITFPTASALPAASSPATISPSLILPPSQRCLPPISLCVGGLPQPCPPQSYLAEASRMAFFGAQAFWGAERAQRVSPQLQLERGSGPGAGPAGLFTRHIPGPEEVVQG